MVSKKKGFTATERDGGRIRQLRDAFREWQAEADVGRLVFVDESGSHVGMTRLYGRAPVGELVDERVPRNRGTVTTIIGALTLDGIDALMTIEGGTSGDVFLAYVDNVLAPTLREGDVVVMDNLGAHKDPRVHKAIRATGARVKWLPPYSPDLNPIELAWSKVKWFPRTAKARTVDALNNALAMAMSYVTPEDARGWIRHCGYPGQPT